MNPNKLAALLVAAVCATSLVVCGAKMTEQAQAVQAQISELPETYSDEADEAIEAARTAYDALTEDEKNTVDAAALIAIEQAECEAKAEEINGMIDEVKVSNTSYSELSKAKTAVSDIMTKVSELPEEADEFVSYDKLLKKIEDISGEYSSTILNADTDIEALQNIFTNINNIYSSYSSSSKYGYACDIATDVSKLSGNLSSLKSKLKTPVSDLKNACLSGGDIEITLAALDVIQAIPDNPASFYDPYLNADGFLDDCLEWQQTVEQRMDNAGEAEPTTSSN